MSSSAISRLLLKPVERGAMSEKDFGL